MSLSINFEPHSWYRGFAIQERKILSIRTNKPVRTTWYGVTANGMTGYLVEFEADTQADLKQQIKEYRGR